MLGSQAENSQARALCSMLLAVGLYSLMPLLLDSAGWAPVALLTGFLMVAQSVTVLALAPIMGANAVPAAAQAKRLSVLGGWRLVRACWDTVPWLVRVAMFVASLQWVFFAWSVRLIDAAVTTVVFEFWPALFLVIGPLIRRVWSGRSDVSGPIKALTSPMDLVLVVLAATGLALVVASEGSASGSAPDRGGELGIILAGVALMLATLGAVVQITVGEQPRLRRRAADNLKARAPGGSDWEGPSELVLRVSLTGVAQVLPRLAAGLIAIIWSLLDVVGDGSGLSTAAIAAGVGIGLIWGCAEPLFWLANHLSRSDTINSLYYGVPVAALTWLWLGTDLNIENVSMFLAGVTGVVAVNMALHLDPEGTGRDRQNSDVPTSGHGFKALVIALWASGALMVVRDDLLPESMLRWSMPEYWALLALGATVFVLILSFRQARLADRRREADRVMLSVHADIDSCHDDGLLDNDSRDLLLDSLHDIDTGREVKNIGSAYLELRATLMGSALPAAPAGAGGRGRLRALMRDVEILANLRQGGRNTVELMVMTLFAALTVFVALFVRPQMPGGEPEPWAAFVAELFVVAFASAVGYLVFDLLDRRLARDRSLLRRVSERAFNKHGQPPGWRLNLDSYTNPKPHRVFANLLGCGIFTMFALLIYTKWF